MDSVGIDRPNDGDDATRRAPALSRRIVYLLNPADDVEFRTAVEAAERDGMTTPSELEARLRASAPRVLVRRRELDAEPVEVWYVYREGHWIPTEDHR
jgi:hypothetical protein